MKLDPRLANETLLILAAKRRQATRQAEAWEHTEGLFALLQAAKRLPQREPWELDDIADSGLGRLLKEARLRVQPETIREKCAGA
jgi:hypothetical protein